MAQFLGSVSGQRGEATRLGSKKSGLTVSAASWAGKVTVRMYHDEKTGEDRFVVEQGQHHGRGIREEIASGVVGQPVYAG